MGVAAFFTTQNGLQYADAPDLQLVVIGVGVYLFVLYVFLFRQGLGKNLLNSQLVDLEDPACKAHFANLDRSTGNALEQAPIFLTSLILYAGLVDAKLGAIFSFMYSAFLAFYPAVFGSPRLLIASTMPRYLIVEYMIAAVVTAAFRTQHSKGQ
eukprot:CAMPEP_0179106236 /NCGR_PEP_ID=MMETSP0796-20121207/49385_1 /TAXON_ID=73915 /ORGANISM="Pyrodinium bahamense, Strain pbaha01" /LENGTH=153 /DNA_ID=CAMNT_0020804259 /DNA_START=197 /DNA_END=658 /DNA_ORIENTATION=+